LKRVLALVEGQTEETFVRDVLAPHLEGHGVGVVPIVLATKRIKSGGKFRGGVSSYQQFKRDLQRLLGDRSAAAITMMLDYYGLPKDFPGAGTQRGHTCYDRATHLQESLQSDLQDRRLIPYLSLHEFEALLFTSPETLAGTLLKPQVLRQLAAMVEGVESPEEINDGASTHPSARIKRLLPTYSKSLHGPLIVQRIGLTEIRRHCPHFDCLASTTFVPQRQLDLCRVVSPIIVVVGGWDRSWASPAPGGEGARGRGVVFHKKSAAFPQLFHSQAA